MGRSGDAAARSRAVGASLNAWYRTHRRPLPWRRDRDPYRIWVAEVLLQQTRVAQAVPYFERFTARFPNVHALARARLSEVLKAWEGAGYYARARHLHAAAREIVARHGGRVPDTVESLERLPGIGRYIARAVASLAFGRPVVALEANGLRVAARWTREEGDPRSSVVRARLEEALEKRRASRSAGPFNEAVMELGETVCGPTHPLCDECPVSFGCRAFLELVDPGRIPRRTPRRGRPHRRAAVVVVTDRAGRWFLQRRPPGGLLGGLWEFPGGKIEPGELPWDAARRELREETGIRLDRLVPAGVVRHAYSHFTVELHVFRGGPIPSTLRPGPGRRWVRPELVDSLPLPRATQKIVRRLTDPDTVSPGSGSRRGRNAASPRRATRARRPQAPARRTIA